MKKAIDHLFSVFGNVFIIFKIGFIAFLIFVFVAVPFTYDATKGKFSSSYAIASGDDDDDDDDDDGGQRT